MPLPTLHTPRLILRPFALTDAADVQRLAGVFAVADMTATIPHPYPDGAAEEWIAGHEAEYNCGTGVSLAVTEQEAGALLGAVSLLGINPRHAHAELGYWIGVPFWGQGFCTEAAAALVDYGFRELGLHRVHSCHHARNPASGRVMQKLGMAREGCFRDHVRHGDSWDNLEQYGLLACEWLAAPQQ